MDADVVVIGGGVAGSAAAARLASAGKRVVVLERETVFPDRIRGEGMGAWGFAQVAALGLSEVVLATPRVNVATRLVPYDETRSIETAEKLALDASQLFPESPGGICVGHPDLREQLITHAAAVGAQVHRGVSSVEAVDEGARCTVRYSIGERAESITTRLVIGADGKDSPLRRMLGLELHSTTPRYLLTGMLVDDGGAWDRRAMAAGVEGGWKFYIQPRGEGLVRLYLAQPIDGERPFSGPDRAQRFLDQFDFACIPESEALHRSTPMSQCAGHPMNDAWLDSPVAGRIVLVGDAAGWSDPIIGQGLTVAFCDARVLTDGLLESDDWFDGPLRSYEAERAERMRRLRFANAVTTLFDQIGAEPAERARKLERMSARIAAEPELGRCRAILPRGPWHPPAEVFEPANLVALATA